MSTPRIVDSTILGSQLNNKCKELIFSPAFLNSLHGEVLELIYSHENNFDQFDMSIDVLVGITNYRLFKIERKEVHSIHRSNINNSTIKHVSEGLFRWDKIKFFDDKKEEHSYGIYHKNTCNYFIRYLKEKQFQIYKPPVSKEISEETVLSKIDKKLEELNKKTDLTNSKLDINKKDLKNITGKLINMQDSTDKVKSTTEALLTISSNVT